MSADAGTAVPASVLAHFPPFRFPPQFSHGRPQSLTRSSASLALATPMSHLRLLPVASSAMRAGVDPGLVACWRKSSRPAEVLKYCRASEEGGRTTLRVERRLMRTKVEGEVVRRAWSEGSEVGESERRVMKNMEMVDRREIIRML